MAGGEKVDMENAGKHRGWMLSGISFQSADGGIRTRPLFGAKSIEKGGKLRIL